MANRIHLFSALFVSILLYVAVDVSKNDSEVWYFAYGSNLLKKQMQKVAPSARYYIVASLAGYRLDFVTQDEVWNGATATIVEDSNKTVVGGLWSIDVNDLPLLDWYEGVYRDWYYVKNVTVVTLHGRKIVARTYQQPVTPPEKRDYDDLPYERRPSNTYLETIIFGGIECDLPSDYLGFLVSFPTNGKFADNKIREELGYPFGPRLA